MSNLESNLVPDSATQNSDISEEGSHVSVEQKSSAERLTKFTESVKTYFNNHPDAVRKITTFGMAMVAGGTALFGGKFAPEKRVEAGDITPNKPTKDEIQDAITTATTGAEAADTQIAEDNLVAQAMRDAAKPVENVTNPQQEHISIDQVVENISEVSQAPAEYLKQQAAVREALENGVRTKNAAYLNFMVEPQTLDGESASVTGESLQGWWKSRMELIDTNPEILDYDILLARLVQAVDNLDTFTEANAFQRGGLGVETFDDVFDFTRRSGSGFEETEVKFNIRWDKREDAKAIVSERDIDHGIYALIDADLRARGIDPLAEENQVLRDELFERTLTSMGIDPLDEDTDSDGRFDEYNATELELDDGSEIPVNTSFKKGTGQILLVGIRDNDEGNTLHIYAFDVSPVETEDDADEDMTITMEDQYYIYRMDAKGNLLVPIPKQQEVITQTQNATQQKQTQAASQLGEEETEEKRGHWGPNQERNQSEDQKNKDSYGVPGWTPRE